MKTFDDDMVRLNMSIGTFTFPCKEVGLTWPPPERLFVEGPKLREANDEDPQGEVLIRDGISEITDEQREQMTHVVRGAEYFYPDA
jgi:hypothetical protein